MTDSGHSYPLPPDTPAGTVAGARQKLLWEVKKAKEKATLALQQGGATSSTTERRWGAGTVDSASQGWGDQLGSLPPSTAPETEAPRKKASASPQRQTKVQSPTSPCMGAQGLQTTPEATSRPLVSRAPALVLSAQEPQAVDTSPGETLTQPGQKQQAPSVEALQASAQRAPVKPDKFASINTKQPTSFPQIPLPVVRNGGRGKGRVGVGAGTQ